jgi:hypothetical protein
MAARGLSTHNRPMKNTNPFPVASPADSRTQSTTAISRQSQRQISPPEDEVARKAYFIYLDQGCPQGQDKQHWFEAEAQLVAARIPGRETLATKV